MDGASHERNYGRIDRFITIQEDGRSLGYNYSTRKSITLKYEAVIKPELFEGCKVQYQGMDNQKPLIQPIQSLVQWLDRAEDLGITYERLSKD